MDLTHAGTPASQPKGQGGDTSRKTWRSSWWDFYPVLERPRRPLVWSQSAVIWTAHPTQPLIVGRHFSSSKQFVLPSPALVISSLGSFEPPTVISVMPTDDWLFAFYPRKDGEGIGCIWKRGPQIDNWQVKDSWTFPTCGGAVAASWLGNPREWACLPFGMPTRLPFRGPQTPVSNPTLLVVTEDCGICVFYYRYIVPGLRSVKRSLTFPGITVESSNLPIATDGLENPNGAKHCVDATIGIGYNQSTIFVATHSRKIPATIHESLDSAQFNSINNVDKSFDFDIWGEEHSVEIHEVHFKFDGVIMSILCHTFGTLDIGNLCITSMTLLCAPPAPPQSSGDGEEKSSKTHEKGRTFLALSMVDFCDYTAPPTSNLALYSVVEKTNRGNLSLLAVNHETTRSISEGVVVHIDSFVDFSTSCNIVLQAYALHHSGSLTPGNTKTKELPAGKIWVLNIPDLGDNPQFDPAVVEYLWDSIGRDLPIFASSSPSHRLLCTLSSSHWKTRIAIHTLPKHKAPDLHYNTHLASQLAIAMLERRSTADITRDIVSPKTPQSHVADIIFQSLQMLDKFKYSPHASTWDTMGAALEIYRAKARLSQDEKEKEILEDRWRVAHDICSIFACDFAFEDCKEEERYDLEAAWQLIGLCSWVVRFTETLMKATVLCHGSGTAQDEPSPPLAPHLLCLAHPFILQYLIVALKHVITMRAYIGSLPAGGENPQMAQLILIDLVDGSGIDFSALVLLLEEGLPIAKKLDSQVCQKALANCQPVTEMQPFLIKLIDDIYDSAKILNKTTLFIKPFDLVDGIASLSVDPRKADGYDVITKKILPKDKPKIECLRCGGRSVRSEAIDKVSGMPAADWVIWERMWQLRCVCGGPWFSMH